MEKILVFKDGSYDECIAYVGERVGGKFASHACSSGVFCRDGKTTIEFSTRKIYEPYVRAETENAVAEVLTLAYKYRFFEKALPYLRLKEQEKDVLLTALVSADFETDKEYLRRRIATLENYPLDGVFAFRMQDMKEGWKRTSACLSEEFDERALDSFVGWIAEEGKGRVFLLDDVLYDEEYRPMKKSVLTGGYSAKKEMLHSRAKYAYCFGEQSEETKAFLKRYYADRTFFCRGKVE